MSNFLGTSDRCLHSQWPVVCSFYHPLSQTEDLTPNSNFDCSTKIGINHFSHVSEIRFLFSSFKLISFDSIVNALLIIKVCFQRLVNRGPARRRRRLIAEWNETADERKATVTTLPTFSFASGIVVGWRDGRNRSSISSWTLCSMEKISWITHNSSFYHIAQLMYSLESVKYEQ